MMLRYRTAGRRFFFTVCSPLLLPPELIPLRCPCPPCARRTSDDEVKGMPFVVLVVVCGAVWFRPHFRRTYALLRLLLLLLLLLLPPPRCRSVVACLPTMVSPCRRISGPYSIRAYQTPGRLVRRMRCVAC